MRVTVATLVLATLALSAGLLMPRPERAAADDNISGEWLFYIDAQAPCTTTVIQADSGTYLQKAAFTLTAPCATYSISFTIDVRDGSVTGVGQDGYPAFQGVVTGGGHIISGVWFYSNFSGTFHMTGGAGDPKFPTPTSTPCGGPCPTPTPNPVGGMAFDPPSSGGSGFYAWWLAAIAGVAFVTLGGAGLFARRRG